MPEYNFNIRETLSEKEEKFEKFRNSIGLYLGPLVSIIYYFLPHGGLNPEAHTLTAIIFWVVIWWVTEPVPIPVTALIGALLCILTGVADVKRVFIPFADPIIFLFMASFMIAKAMAIHKLDKRFAYGIMSLKIVGESSFRILFVFGAITAFLSMWISNTATAAMMYPIAIGIIFSIVMNCILI